MNVEKFLCDAILELKDIDESELVPSLSFEELALDSLDYVEIQLLIQKRFKVAIGPELFSTGKLKNLGDLYRHIEANQEQALAA
ncbi:acyl carrier protein [Undibacterium cyanobacteriorum]|uniref:Acyl carrier protein n=1 Tax=Undibacterium cyanobacteriorum TaxID=3073561 RepID=A0ABY9RJZ3_9BURK|nr:acyl carrier protein [Undibacterium sp. 20NA77.5]WMW81545.1 acyl carrier protein [Undibacterium sp. 20NA77.5]